jgi:hypothetical protein
MLLLNGNPNVSGPIFIGAGASVLHTHHSNHSRSERQRNFYVGEGTVGARNADIPVGYGAPYAWMLAPEGGGLSAFNTVSGEGTIASASLAMGVGAAASLTGSGTVSSAALSMIVAFSAALTGSGTISSATLQASLALAAALTGSGSVSAAALSLIVAIEADLSGSGGASGNLKGELSMESDITVTGTGLSTANVGSAVWSYLIENGLTAAQVQSILLAVAAGETRIDLTGPNPIVKFRNQTDTRDRITATMVGSERSAITLDNAP